MFHVKKKYAKGPEQQLEQFKAEQEARDFIRQKLVEDRNLKLNVTYLLYDWHDLLESFDQQSELLSGADTGGQQQSSGQRFSPSPLQTSARPGGMHSSFKDDDDDKKE